MIIAPREKNVPAIKKGYVAFFATLKDHVVSVAELSSAVAEWLSLPVLRCGICLFGNSEELDRA